MERIAQEAHHRQRMLQYGKTHSATETALRYRVSRKTYYKWLNRWDGSAASVQDRSRRPHHSPRKQKDEELAKVKRYALRYGCDRLLGYQAICAKGYQRSYGCYKRTARTFGDDTPKKKPKRKNKPYERAEYPGQKVQLDVKFVPNYCVADGQKYYQFTAKDECSRWTYREMYAEHSTYSAKDFLVKLIRAAPFPIRMIQTDNGAEFTNALLVIKAQYKTLFEEALLELGIFYHRIRIATPRHNGKVERQHRTDELRFYRNLRMFHLEDGRRQLAVYQRKSNNYMMTCLHMKTPNQVVALYQGIM